jgi:hypothetical protein
MANKSSPYTTCDTTHDIVIICVICMFPKQCVRHIIHSCRYATHHTHTPHTDDTHTHTHALHTDDTHTPHTHTPHTHTLHTFINTLTPDLTAAWNAPSTAALPPISVFIPAMLVVGVLMERPPVSYTIPTGNREQGREGGGEEIF